MLSVTENATVIKIEAKRSWSQDDKDLVLALLRREAADTPVPPPAVDLNPVLVRLEALASRFEQVVVEPAPQVLGSITISPTTVRVSPGSSIRFRAEGWYAGASEPHNTPVIWSCTQGVIDQSGLWIASTNVGTFKVMARSTVPGQEFRTAEVPVIVAMSPSGDPSLPVEPSDPPPEPGEAFGGVSWADELSDGMDPFLLWDGASAISPMYHEIVGNVTTNVVDVTSPFPDGRVCRHRQDPTGQPLGSQLSGGFVAVFELDADEVLVKRAIKFATDPFLVDSGGSKTCMIPTDSHGTVYFNMALDPNGYPILQPIVSMPQNEAHDMRFDTWLARNAGTNSVPRGEWVKWTIYLKMNTPGVFNGILRTYANDVMMHNYTDLRFLAEGEVDQWKIVNNNWYHNNMQDPPISVFQDILIDEMDIYKKAA